MIAITETQIAAFAIYFVAAVVIAAVAYLLFDE